MKRLIVSALVISAVVLSSVPEKADAQAAREIVGTWNLVSNTSEQGGTRTDVYGPNPSGTLVFGSDGRYALIFLRRDLPKFAANTRISGTADENKAVVHGSTAHFGSYSVDEAGKTLTFRIESSTFPNWTGTEQRRAMAISGDELSYTSPGTAGTPAQVTMRRAK